MQRTCPSCGNAVSEQAVFCRSCGTRLANEPPDAAVHFQDLSPAVIPPPAPGPPNTGGRLCSHCGATWAETAAFCRNCGASLATPVSAPSPRIRTRRLFPLVMLAGAACLLLFVLGVAAVCMYLPWESGRWDLLPSMLTSIWHNGWSGRLRPADLAESTSTPALDVNLAPGIRLSAPRGALDRPRQFRATPFSHKRLNELVQVASEAMVAPVAGYDIDGGMTEDELFNGQVNLAFDLTRLDVPKELWESVSIARLAPDGTLQHMVTNRENGGNTVSCQIRHNNPYLLLIMILGLKALYVTDQVSKGALDDTLGCNIDPYFRIEWPSSLPLRETAERRALDRRFKELWDRYKPPDSQKNDLEIVGQRLKQYMADPEVKRTYATFNDVEWKKKNYFPPKVAHVVDAFQKAGKYIFEVRGFRKRGERIEVRCLTPWTGNAETYGYSKDGHFTYPYIHMNLDKMPVQDNTDAGRAALDNLRVTAVHELFHVCQKEYYNWTKYTNPGQIWGGGVNHWFMEATALVFEEEAKDYYLTQKWNAEFPLTADNLYASQKASPGASRKKLYAYYKVPMDSGGSETESAHRGYAASLFLLDLRQRYYSRNPQAFLPALLEAFGSFRSGSIDALIKVTSGSETVFGADYLLFCAQGAANIFDEYPPTSVDESLNPAEPMISWPLVGPLSSPCLAARIRGLGGADLQKSKILVRTGDFRDQGQVRRREPSGDFKSITGASLLLSRTDMGSAASQVGVSLQRVETYVKKQDFPSLSETQILLLAPPREKPRVQFDMARQVVRLEIPPSVLRHQGQVKDYRVTLYRMANGKPLTFTTEGKSEVEIAWRQIAEVESTGFSSLPIPVSIISPQELLDMLEVAQYVNLKQGKGPRLQLSYHEVVPEFSLISPKSRDIEGPESEIFEVPVEGFQVPGARYDVSGAWNGNIWIARIPLSLELNQSGDKLTGTWSWGSETYRVDGTWNGQKDAWEIMLWVKEGKTEVPSLISLYLRALPGEKLWLGAPPCVLRRPVAKAENKGGWFSWFKW